MEIKNYIYMPSDQKPNIDNYSTILSIFNTIFLPRAEKQKFSQNP